VTLLAAYSGQKLGGVLKPKLLDTLLGLLFGAIGIYIIYTALR
jgi:putative Ca2+/H+ antiporter (TMEM165/GDT1 family)